MEEDCGKKRQQAVRPFLVVNEFCFSQEVTHQNGKSRMCRYGGKHSEKPGLQAVV